MSVLARLGQDVSFEQADARVAALAPQWNPEWASTGVTTRLRSLNQLAGLGIDARFSWVQQRRGALFLLFGAVACVLLIACANAANLFLSRALSRTREFAIRAAAGASRPRLCRQLLTESVVISALAGLVGLALAAWLAGVVAAAVPPELGRRLLNPIDVDARVTSWAVLAALLAGVAATVPPALRTIGRDLMRPIQGRGSEAAGGHVVATALAEPRFYTTLLAAFALLAVLLAGAGLYAVVAYETNARTQEIGVRVALGATRGAVIRHVLGRSLLQSAAGVALGLLGALALTRWLAPLLYETAPTDPRDVRGGRGVPAGGGARRRLAAGLPGGAHRPHEGATRRVARRPLPSTRSASLGQCSI